MATRTRLYNRDGSKAKPGTFDVLCDGCGRKPERIRWIIVGEEVKDFCVSCALEKYYTTEPRKPDAEKLTAVIPHFDGKPSKVILMSNEFAVHSWCAVLEVVFDQIMKSNPVAFSKIVESFPQFIGLDQGQFSRAKRVTDTMYFFEGRIPTKKLLSIFSKVREIAGFSPDELRVVA